MSFTGWCSGSGGSGCLVSATLAFRGYGSPPLPRRFRISWFLLEFLPLHSKKKAAAFLTDRSDVRGKKFLFFAAEVTVSGPMLLAYESIYRKFAVLIA